MPRSLNGLGVLLADEDISREESRDSVEHRYVEHDLSPSERIAEQPYRPAATRII